jgi:excisionase family DNA binding protein
MERKPDLKLGRAELMSMFADAEWSRAFPPVLTVETAARLADVKISTIYDWSSRGLLKSCAVKKGKKLRFVRDRFIQFLFNN